MDIREKIKDVNQKLNAVVTLIDEYADSEITIDSPLKGEYIAVKDNFSTKDILTTASCKILSNYIPKYDATVITKLKQAGIKMVAKTTMDELAMGGTGTTPYQGVTHNPFDYERIAGGSSSGSAALVGSGVVDLALGSDTGDSVRKPASYCGIVGVKPTYGRISRYGVIPYCSSLDHVAYFSRTVLQSAQLLEVLAGFDEKDMTSADVKVDDYSNIKGDLAGKKIAVITNLMDAKKDDELKAGFNLLLHDLAKAGVEVVHLTMDQELLDVLLPVYYVIANCEATANHANLDGVRFGVRESGNNLEEIMINSRTKGFGFLLKKRFVIGSYGLDDQHQEEIFLKAKKIRRLIVDNYAAVLKDVDGILTLASDDVAPLIKDVNNNMSVNSKHVLADNHLVLGNFSGFPSITLPLGRVGDLPYGINLTTKAFSEKLMFDLALGIEKIINEKGGY